MLTDNDLQIRNLAIQQISKARQNSSNFEGQVRPYIKPNVNFEATNYTELIDWEKETITEPPICKDLALDQLNEFVRPTFLCHTQGTERLIRLVTNASERVYGEERRDGLIRATLKSRGLNPNADLNKKDFKFM